MDNPQVQVLLHKTPAVALIEERYGGMKAVGGRACPLSLVPSTGLTFKNCKLQKLARAKCLTLFDLQPYGENLQEEENKEINKQDKGKGERKRKNKQIK